MDTQANRNRFGAARRTMIPVLVMVLLTLPGTAAAGVASASPLKSSWFVDMNRFAESAHAGFKCQDCHANIGAASQGHPDRAHPDFLKKPATRTYDYRQCLRCHKVAYDRYQTGAHAKARAKEAAESPPQGLPDHPGMPAPTCGDCHSSHYERSKLSRLDIGRQMVDTCGKCHPEHTASYLENIHGKAGVNLGNPKSAFCTDCHGAHAIGSLKTPEATLPTCQRCHPEAETEFANFVIHASIDSVSGNDSPKKASVIWIHRVQIAAVVVVALSLVFFFGHTLMWLLRETHEKLRKP